MSLWTRKKKSTRPSQARPSSSYDSREAVSPGSPPFTQMSETDRGLGPSAGFGITVLTEESNHDAALDVVFVHGLMGNARTTWTHRASGTFWPRDLLPRDVPNVRVMTFGYPADIVNLLRPTSTSGVTNHAASLVGALEGIRMRTRTTDRPIFFVAHSMGGLVVQWALQHSNRSPEPHLKQIESCTRGIIFMGTPNYGSNLAAWAAFATNLARILDPNTKLVEVLKPESELLRTIQEGYHSLVRNRAATTSMSIVMTCFYEELKTNGLDVVNQDSARIQGYSCYPINANHSNMTKFSSSEDPGYTAVLTEILRCVRGVENSVRPTDRGKTILSTNMVTTFPPQLPPRPQIEPSMRG
jgi:pimeloyl-ACP methyl ester carboxylesterase